MNNYNELSIDTLREVISTYLKDKEVNRTIKIRTGSMDGQDIIEEKLDNAMGYERVNIGFRVLRILNKTNIKKNNKGKYYKLLKINLVEQK